MSVVRKDLMATLLTALAVLVYASTREGWNVWLVGSSHRWAAGAMLVLGALTCGQGTAKSRAAMWFFGILGTAGAVLAAIALANDALWPVTLLAGDLVLLWVLSTLGHLVHGSHHPVMT